MKPEDQERSGADVSTQLAQERTDLAVDRSYLASDRTLMAWIRTSLSMISFGFTIGKLANVLADVRFTGPLGRIRTVSIEGLAYALLLIGTVALLAAALQHHRRVEALYAMGLQRQFSISFVVALFLTAVGGFALASLVMSL